MIEDFVEITRPVGKAAPHRVQIGLPPRRQPLRRPIPHPPILCLSSLSHLSSLSTSSWTRTPPSCTSDRLSFSLSGQSRGRVVEKPCDLVCSVGLVTNRKAPQAFRSRQPRYYRLSQTRIPFFPLPSLFPTLPHWSLATRLDWYLGPFKSHSRVLSICCCPVSSEFELCFP